MLSVLSGCDLSRKKELIIVSDYCALTPEFNYTEKSKKALLNSEDEIFYFTKISETTRVCYCEKPPEKRQKCFNKLTNGFKQTKKTTRD